MTLDPATLNHAEALGLAARSIVEGLLSGDHPSPFKGFSVEFSQHRQYVPGDDPRHLDWKVLGRTDRYYLKQFEQETNFIAHVLLDGSESMRFRGADDRPSKFDAGRMLAACLCHLILRQRDAVSLHLFDGEVRAMVPRTGNLASMGPILTTLSDFQPARRTDVGAILHRIAAEQKRRGIVILISDLLDDEDAILAGIRHVRFAGHEPIVFHVLDQMELDFDFDGDVRFDGLESTGTLTARPADVRTTYLRNLANFLGKIRDGCERNNCHYVQLNTARPLHETLGEYLAFRRRVHR